MIVRAAPKSRFWWLGCSIGPGFAAIEAVESGRILAMVGYDHWTPTSVQMHVRLDSPAAGRRILEPAFEYPFTQLNRLLAVGMVRASNVRSVRLARHLGFRETYHIKDAAAQGDDLIIFEMRRNECRWIEQEGFHVDGLSARCA